MTEGQHNAHRERLLADFAERAIPPADDPALGRLLRACIAEGLADLPRPGTGQTLRRWRMLARVAATDLSLLKLYEGHTDAQAILGELGAAADTEGLWAVWAAEPPQARVRIASRDGDRVRLNGHKAWCSGAALVDRALVTVWDEDERPQLVAVSLAQPGVRVGDQGWQAVGMAATASVEVTFEHAVARRIGAPGAYLQRPGFWQGGAGIAASWYGASQALAEYLRRRCRTTPDDAHAAAHLGAVDAALHGAAGSLRECAAWIDRHPAQSAEYPVRRLRAQVEAATEEVLRHVGRALGATPFCRDARFARLSADLPVFIRQSHAERDLAELGAQAAEQPQGSWAL